MRNSKIRIECSNKKCRRTMRESELVAGKVNGIATTMVCPRCSCESYYRIDEPVTNERIEQCNQLLQLIASFGHKYFSDKNGYVSTLELGKNGRVLFVDYYTRRRIDTHLHKWTGFTSGGTLADLIARLSDYIKKGEKLPMSVIGHYRADGSNVWGYPADELEALRVQVSKLPIFQTGEVSA